MDIKPQSINAGFVFADGIRKLYASNQTDYNMEPIILCNNENQPIGRIKTGDSVIFCCRRGEREIQLTEAFSDPDYPHFHRNERGPFTFSIFHHALQISGAKFCQNWKRRNHPCNVAMSYYFTKRLQLHV